MATATTTNPAPYHDCIQHTAMAIMMIAAMLMLVVAK